MSKLPKLPNLITISSMEAMIWHSKVRIIVTLTVCYVYSLCAEQYIISSQIWQLYYNFNVLFPAVWIAFFFQGTYQEVKQTELVSIYILKYFSRNISAESSLLQKIQLSNCGILNILSCSFQLNFNYCFSVRSKYQKAVKCSIQMDFRNRPFVLLPILQV